jgi:hypothetical protein
MDTITIDNITYNEIEVRQYKNEYDNAGTMKELLNEFRRKVRDFFSELEWEDNEATVTKSEVNELLEAIGCDILVTTFRATVNITAYVTDYEATDEEDANTCIADDIAVDIGTGRIEVSSLEVTDIECDD